MKTPYDRPEAIASFNRIAKTVATKARKLAAGALESDERRKVVQALRTSGESLSYLARYVSDEAEEREDYYARVDGLRAAVRFADASNALNMREARELESARLRRAIREAAANEDGFLRELRINAARQGRTW